MIAAGSGWGNDWPYVAAPYVFYCFTVFWLLVMGDHGEERNPIKIFFKRISYSLERVTGLAGWAAAGVLSGLLSLGVAVVGLYWDVAWHIDFGRDKALFTTSHTMILLGLGGMVYAALIAVIFATLDKAPVGFKVAGLVVPWSAVMLTVLGVGGVVAFPVDNLWHQTYGIDVTLWSPSHLQLVAGGSLGPIAVLLMLLEGRRQSSPNVLGHIIMGTTAGAVLVGLSTFQGEFDFGVPQFQALYLPILICVAAGFSLVLARLALGAGGALGAVAAFLFLRGVIGLLVGGALNHTFPRFPLYLVAAVCVEVVAYLAGTERTLRFGVLSGAAIGTLGLVGESIWIEASGWARTSPQLLLPATVLGLVSAVAAAVVGAGMGRAWRREGVATTPVPVAAVAAGILAVIVVLAIPLPRNVGDVEAIIRVQPEGEGMARIEVQTVPADAADDAIAFGITSWQGGGREQAELEKAGDGTWTTDRTFPITGEWKTMVSLLRGSEVMAAPVYMPADPEIGASEVPALPERRIAFARNTDVFLREAKDGPAYVANLAYLVVFLVAAAWVGMFAFTGRRLASDDDEPTDWSPPPAPPRWGAEAPLPESATPLPAGYRRSWADVGS